AGGRNANVWRLLWTCISRGCRPRARGDPVLAGRLDSRLRGNDLWMESLPRGYAENPAIAGISHQIDCAVRTLPHVADALAEAVQQALLLHDLLAVEFEPHQ